MRGTASVSVELVAVNVFDRCQATGRADQMHIGCSLASKLRVEKTLEPF
jgi:hypothetical protein